MNKPLKNFIIIITAFLFAVLFIYYARMSNYLNFHYIKGHQQAIQNFITSHYRTAVLLYMSIFSAGIFFLLSLSLVLTVAGGFFFGIVPATVFSMASILLGGLASLLTIRYALSHWLAVRYQHAVEKFKYKFQKHGASYLLSLQFFPLTPLPLINIMAGLSDVSISTFLWTTALGALPMTLFCAFAGQQLATINSMKDVLSFPTLCALAILSVITLLPLLLQYVSSKIKNN